MKLRENLAPIALFVYNRPAHTLQTLIALENNELANESLLYIFCDGPKFGISDKELKAIKEVRDTIKKKNWCSHIIIEESDFNKGLANSIIDGVTKIVNKHGKIIVLEDDIVTSTGFLKYMNQALTKYRDNNRVMSINAYVPPFKTNGNHAYFIENGTSTWGWGTWKRAWQYFNKDAKNLHDQLKRLTKKEEYKYNWNNSYNYSKMLTNYIIGRNNSWGIRWYSSVFFQKGFGLFPPYSLIQNIGHDGTGEHCGTSELFHHNILKNDLIILPDNLSIRTNNYMYKKFTHYNKSLRPNILKRMTVNLLKKIWHTII